MGGRRRGRRARPAGEGPDARHRHGRAGTSAWAWASTASPPCGSAYQQRQRMPRFFQPDDLNIPDVQQRVHWDAEWARRAGNPAVLRLRPHARDLAHPPLHRLDGRRRLALEARLPVPEVQLRRRHPLDAGPGHPQVPDRRGTGRRSTSSSGARTSAARPPPPATPRSCCPRREHGPVAPARLRPAAPPTCQEALDALAERFATEEAAVKPYPTVAAGPRRRRTTVPVLRIRLDRPDRRNSRHRRHRLRPRRRRRRRGERRERPGDPPQRDGRPLLLGVRPRRAHARSRPATGRVDPSTHARPREPPDPGDAHRADPDRVHRAGLGHRAGPRPGAGRRLHDRGRRRPAVGAVHDVRVHAGQRRHRG